MLPGIHRANGDSTGKGRKRNSFLINKASNRISWLCASVRQVDRSHKRPSHALLTTQHFISVLNLTTFRDCGVHNLDTIFLE